MDFEEFDDSDKNLSATEIVAQNIDTQNQAATDAGDENFKAFQEELSGTTNRPDRFGVGENTRNAKSALERQSKSTGSFMAVASAQAYEQTVSFNVGGRGVSINLGDLRNVTSDLRNQYGDKVRGGSASAKDRERMKAYDGLLRLIDDVATGKASQEELNEYMEKHDLSQEIVDAAFSNPDIVVTDTTPHELETELAGAHADQSAADLNAGLADDLYPIR